MMQNLSFSIIDFQNEKANTFTLLIILIVKSLQIELLSTNLLLCRNKCATTPRKLTLGNNIQSNRIKRDEIRRNN